MLNLFKKSTLKTIDKNSLDKEIESFKNKGTTGDDEGLIISLTSFPQRMYEIHYTLYSLLTQTVKPAKVVLWLGSEQFPNGEKDIPPKVLKLKENGLVIEWHKNLRSYTKLVPSLKKYPNNIIVTADDDIYYEKDWLEKLLKSHKENKNCIICHRAHRVKFDREKLAPYKKWPKKIKGGKASYLNFLTGVGGVLYPQNSLHKDVLKEELFTELAPKADDVWFWAMAVLNKTKILVVKDWIRELTYVNPERERGLTDEITLFSFNKKGGNDLQIEKVLNHYPQIIDILKEKN
ncbi:MAG TPA: glycosyltransferase family 2 protein [Candidatus Stercorousia faecigallinarum]|nr:glycosyltransferase family 2 protein [Candidatus Stercorousia faecigallinarum]